MNDTDTDTDTYLLPSPNLWENALSEIWSIKNYSELYTEKCDDWKKCA